MADDFQCGLVLLAAGASHRMGQPKQLLPVNGQPLVRHAAEAACAAPVAPVVVVLGAHAEAIRATLSGLPVQIMIHDGWAEGMGSSLAAGVKEALRLNPRLPGLIVALADQPGLPDGHLAKLMEVRHQTDRSIVASDVSGVLSPPVLFSAEWFPHLLALQGEAGARALLQAHREAIATVPLAVTPDLDTPEDYARFTHGSP